MFSSEKHEGYLSPENRAKMQEMLSQSDSARIERWARESGLYRSTIEYMIECGLSDEEIQIIVETAAQYHDPDNVARGVTYNLQVARAQTMVSAREATDTLAAYVEALKKTGGDDENGWD